MGRKREKLLNQEGRMDKMREKRFPGVAQAVAPVCLGTAQFGDSTGESQAFAVLDGYAAAGGNFIDTANCYGKWLPPVRM